MKQKSNYLYLSMVVHSNFFNLLLILQKMTTTNARILHSEVALTHPRLQTLNIYGSGLV